MIRFLSVSLVFLSLFSCGPKEKKKSLDKDENELVGTWVNNTKTCDGTECNCTTIMTFNSDYTFSGNESCEIAEKQYTGDFGGIYDVTNSWLKLEFYDGRDEYYAYFSVRRNTLELIVGNKIKIYLRKSSEVLSR